MQLAFPAAISNISLVNETSAIMAVHCDPECTLQFYGVYPLGVQAEEI